MLKEWFSYLTTPYPAHLRRLGYLRQMIGLGSRYRRCRAAWQTHLDSTRRLILQAADAVPNRDRVLVIGSGLLLDVPLQRLAADFNEVVLVDLQHPPAARRQAKAHPNVRLAEADVTGLSHELARLSRDSLPSHLPRARPEILLEGGADLVVSCNILSQLPLVPREHLEGKLGFRDAAELDAFCRDMLRNHLAWLAAFECRICLVCDRTRRVVRSAGVVEEEDALFDVRLPPADEEWTWDIAPAPEIDRSYSLQHQVIGYRDFKPLP